MMQETDSTGIQAVAHEPLLPTEPSMPPPSPPTPSSPPPQHYYQYTSFPQPSPYRPPPPPSASIQPLVWKEITPSQWDDGPGDLLNYKVIAVNNHIMLFGGQSDEFAGSRGYDVIPTLTVTKKDSCTGISHLKWNFRKASGDIPSERIGHTVTRVGNKVFLFGGRDTSSLRTFNDFYYLDLDLMVWTQIVPPETQVPPSPRYDHTCTYLNKRLFFIGGIDSSIPPPQYKSHIGVFNLESWEWENSSSSTTPPVAIAGHIAIPFTNPTGDMKYILILGGNSHVVDFSKPDFRHSSQHEYLKQAQVYRVESKTWEMRDIDVQLDPTIYHAAAWRPLRDGSLQVFIQGGFKDGSDLPYNMVVLRMDQKGYIWREQKQTFYGLLETPSLRHHSMVIAEDVLYLLGGQKDLGRQPSPYWLLCFQCTDILNNTSVFKIQLPETD